MSLQTNSDFLKVFHTLDNILKDMYPDDVPSKLGTTRYLENMRRKSPWGEDRIPGWRNDYNKLLQLRNARNRVIHENLLDSDTFTQEDIFWMEAFRNRVLSQTDPLARLRSIHPDPNQSVEHNHPLPRKKVDAHDRDFPSAILILSMLSGAFLITLAMVLLLFR